MPPKRRTVRAILRPAAVLLAGLGLPALLGHFPLLDGLTYEYAVTVALVAFAAAVIAGSRAGSRLDEPHELRWKLLERSPRERLEPGLFRAALLLGAAVAAAAAVPIVAGERAGCAWEKGLGVYFFTAWPPIPLGLTLGALTRGLAPRSPARRAGMVAAFVLGSAGLTVYEVLAGPRAVFHNLIVGVVTTSAYLGLDESVRIAPSHVFHRAATLVLAAFLLAFTLARAAARGRPAVAAEAAEADRVGLLLAVERVAARRRAVATGCLIALMVLGGDRFGFGSGRATIERRLAGSRESEHFILRFREPSRASVLAQQLLGDCEWEYARLTRLLGGAAAPRGGGDRKREGRRITVLVYADAGERRELTGASGFLFAKPWQGELHTELAESGELTAFAHELTHVLAARFGLPLLGVSARYGLIEGVAEGVAGGYADRPWRHEPVAAALRTGLLPDAGELIGNRGFVALDARVSYQAAASFCGFLLGRFGPEPLRAAYAWGDFQAAYGRSVAELGREWRSFLAEVPVEPRSLEVAAQAFNREKSPPFFRRSCARLGFRATPGRVTACAARPWECAGDGAPLEAALADLDLASASGPLLERDRALARMAEALATHGRLEESASVLGRRAALGGLSASARRLHEAAARDPLLVPEVLGVLVGTDVPAEVEAVVARSLRLDDSRRPGSPESAAVRRVLGAARDVLGRDLLGRDVYAARIASLDDLGGCTPGLESLEARLLVRGAVLARRAGDRETALRLAGNAASLAGAGPDERRDAEVERERALGGAPGAVGATAPSILDGSSIR